MAATDTQSLDQSHPPDDRLLAFAWGRCDDAEAAQIEAHVLACESCCRRLAETPNDTLLDQLAAHPEIKDTDVRPVNRETALAETETAKVNPGEGQLLDELRNHPKYQLVRTLGAGGMGVVYLAFHRVMHRMVALKVISPRLLQDPAVKTRFRREVQIAGKLQHPNIVAAFDADEIDSNLILVSEFVDGISLDRRVAEKPMAIYEACRIVCQAAEGLAHAHQHGLVHRDVKPQNVLVSAEDQVKVVDFGLANYVEADAGGHGITSAGVIVGTPDYLSPEQIREQPVDHRADIYALGCTLYFALAARPPYEGGSRVEKLAKHLNASPPSVSEIRTDVPPQLELALAKMMAKDPGQRFASAKEVITALEPFCTPAVADANRGGDRMHRSTRTKPTAGPTRRHLLYGIACTTVAMLLAAGWYAGIGGSGSDVRTLPIDERLRLLAVLPEIPLMRDVDLLTDACRRSNVDCHLTFASNVEIEWIPEAIRLAQVDPRRFDAAVVFGAPTIDPPNLTRDISSRGQTLRLLEAFESERKPVGALGAGLWTLSHLDWIDGKQVAGCEHSSEQFKNATGATWLDGQQVVVDGRLVTGSETDDATPFLKALLDLAR